MKPVAVLFDFDGVIADSFEMHRTAWIESYKELFDVPFPELDPEQLTGRSSMAIAESICEAAGVEGVEHYYKRKTEMVVEGILRPDLLPGVKAIIEKLQKSAVPYAVASNAPLAYLESVLAFYDISVPLKLGFEQVTNPKPAPDLFLSAAKQLNIAEDQLENIVVFEDSVPGLQAAKAAGMIPVGIRARFGDEEMREAGATEIFDSLEQVLQKNVFSF